MSWVKRLKVAQSLGLKICKVNYKEKYMNGEILIEKNGIVMPKLFH